MIKTLQKKFIVTAMTAISILLIVLLGGINVANALSSIKHTEQLLEALSKNESELISSGGGNDIGSRGFLMPHLTEDDKISAVFFTVRIDNFGVFTQADVRHISSVSETEAKELAKTVYKDEKLSGRTGRFKFTSVSAADGKGIVYIFMDISSDAYSILRMIAFSAFIGIVCWILMLLLVMMLSQKAIRPIAENIEKQKQFVTDAGHEIKTPLAIILANTEAMELHTGENKWSKNIREQVIRLNGLMQNLLTLAKADETKELANVSEISFSNIANETLQMFREPMELKGLSLHTDIASNIIIHANKEQITRLISTLMDNAVKYSVSESTIYFSLQKVERTAILQIANTCEVLPNCEPQKLFDRFYRADAARTQKNGGYGIGLSVANAIVHMHNGTICAKYEEQNKIIFTVKFS